MNPCAIPSPRLTVLALAAALFATGCASLATGKEQPATPVALEALAPTQWQAPMPALPHNGQLTDLSQWWSQVGDALLVELIDAAQAASPTLATAQSRLSQARATLTTNQAASSPTLDANLSARRDLTQIGVPIGNTVQAGLNAGWEIDLFGANRAASAAALARLEGAQAQWHEARVSVAADVANSYIALRACELELGLAKVDSTSRSQTARLSALTTRAGFTAPGQDALARASAAEAANRVTEQSAKCDLAIKALVALTGLAEPDLRQKVAQAPASRALEATISIASLPAQTLAQRPDVFAAEREVAAASQDLASTDAQRYPRLSLSGNVAAINFSSGGVSTDLNVWSIGPLALSLPLYDGGKRTANVDAARARYQEAAALYRTKVREAVREVEVALVNLNSVAARADNTVVAAEGYRSAFKATEARFKGGLASLPELEDARRTAINADAMQLALQRDRLLAWVALYRAAGGGWRAAPT
jgi:outer membrane protein, multidrug efflux system